MNPSSGEPWRGPSGPPHHGSPEHNPPQPNRSFPSLGMGGPQPQPPQAQPGGNMLMTPSYHPSGPSSGHSLPTLADLTQNNQSVHHQPSPYNTHPPPPNPAHALPALAHALQPPQSIMNQERERDARERERNMEMIQRRQREEQQMREQDQMNRDREQAERTHREQMQHHPVQSHIGSIPMHQPVPSKFANTGHGSSSLLTDLNTRPPPATSAMPLGPGSSSLFASNNQQPENTQRPPYLHPNGQSQQTHQAPAPSSQPAAQAMAGFNGSGPSSMSAQAAIGGQQQPILNDALSYLDQVKVQFNDQPDVYNRFLDIMKDFKSQAIDTPGVIDRVSNLFNGHPQLIQGFNTFLPQGYRIECGTDDNPDAIRVTTPSGTTTQSLQARSRQGFEASSLSHALGNSSLPQPDMVDPNPSGWVQHQGSVAQYSPSRAGHAAPYHQAPTSDQSYENRLEVEAANAALVHQQEQRGVSQLQNAVSAARNGSTNRGTTGLQASPGPGPAATMAQQGGQGLLGGEVKRGPVEFNHAISYVNKIKNRFNQQPETYKQFLDILQTYQRESKPIQDVYAQVTQLFHTAPDLLEDFKQFLPESAAQAKAQAAARAMADEAMISNVRGEYTPGQTAQAQTPRPSTKMPPMGQFDPPSTSKEKKRPRGGAQAANLASGHVDTINVQGRGLQLGLNKRPKVGHHKTVERDLPMLSPTLVPQLPEPIPPQSTLIPPNQPDEITIFDRVRKFIGNKNSYAEFLKLLNLYTNELVDKASFLERLSAFIGGSPDLLAFFHRMVGVDPEDEAHEAQVKPESGRVNLSHCRSLGPSYRHLPRQEMDKPCKGRDAMCHQVLNNEWSSHPTWESEDSGFVAHRKNVYEEGLHRVEEERHDYDFYIESCQRTVQLMEPLLQQVRLLSETDRAHFQIDEKFGGQSKAIPARILMKIYGAHAGKQVIQDLIQDPIAVLPFVLARTKQKLEEWKQSQREWEKVWREQTHKFYWKSLDHQHIINNKGQDKKMFLAKHFTTEIKVRYDERRRQIDAGFPQPTYQFAFGFSDPDIVLDVCQLILHDLQKDNTYTSADQQRMTDFLTKFVPRFFDIDANLFRVRMAFFQAQDLYEEDLDDDANEDDALQRAELLTNKQKGDAIQQQALNKEADKDSGASQSKASSPMTGVVPTDHGDEDTSGNTLAGGVNEASGEEGTNVINADEVMELDVPNPAATQSEAESHVMYWMTHPPVTEGIKANRFKVDAPFERDEFNLFANQNIYHFFRLVESLYSRLFSIKANEGKVREEVTRLQAGQDKPAAKMKMSEKVPSTYFVESESDTSYYSRILILIKRALLNAPDLMVLEDTLRRFYLSSGYPLYSPEKLVGALNLTMSKMVGSDSKDRSQAMLAHFYKNREKTVTTRTEEREYRIASERLAEAAEMYRIRYNPATTKAYIQLFERTTDTFSGEALDEEARWSSYVTAYTMYSPTDCVDHSKCKLAWLKRSCPPEDFDMDNILSLDLQELRIDVKTYKLLFSYNGVPGQPFAYQQKLSDDKRATYAKSIETAAKRRKNVFEEKFVKNNKWMEAEGDEASQRRVRAFDEALKTGLWKMDDLLQRANEAAAPVESVEPMEPMEMETDA